MEERTINQKSFKEIWEKINVPFPEEAYEATAADQRRIKEKCIKQRLDDVFGCCNYDLLIGKPMLEYGPGGQNNGCMAVSCRIAIRDDSGAVVCIKTGMGIAETVEGRSVTALARMCIGDALMYCMESLMHVKAICMVGSDAVNLRKGGAVQCIAGSDSAEAALYLLKITGKAHVRENFGYFVPVEVKGGRKINMYIPFNLTESMTAIEQDKLLNSLMPGLEMQAKAVTDQVEDEQVLRYVSAKCRT